MTGVTGPPSMRIQHPSRTSEEVHRYASVQYDFLFRDTFRSILPILVGNHYGKEAHNKGERRETEPSYSVTLQGKHYNPVLTNDITPFMERRLSVASVERREIPG